MRTASLRNPRTEFIESFRLLAANLRAMSADHPRHLRTLLVMSAYARDGRTTAVLNLGIALAEGGSRVLLVDADLRRPALSRLLDVEATQTLQEIITNGHQPTASEATVGLPTSIEGLHVLPATPIPRNQPIPALAPLLQRLPAADAVDFIILDSPPCLHYADAFQLAPLVDGVLYVVRQRRQDREAQRSIRAQLSQLGVNLLGLVFNRG